jgi:outer membrane protein assembly factor BamB
MLRRLAPTLVLLCAAAWPGAMSAADWPQWGGSLGRTLASGEKNLPDSFVPGTKLPTGGGIDPATTRSVRWAARMGNYAYGNPTVAGGRVFVGTDDALLEDDPRLQRSESGMLQCLDEATGKLIWRLVVPRRTKERLPEGAHYTQQKFGVCSSPAVVGDRVYVLTSACEVACLDVKGLADGNDGPFTDEGQYMVGPGKKPVALSPTDADIIWVFDMVDQLGVCPHDVASGSPLVEGGFVYIETSNGVVSTEPPHDKCLRPDAPSFVVLDAATGRLVATDTEDLGHRMWHCLWSPPSMGEVNGRKLVFFGGADGVCYAFEAVAKAEDKPLHLKKVWSYDCNPPEYKFRDGKPIVYGVGDKRKKYSTNKNDGTYVGPSEIIGTPAFHGGRVYVAIGEDPAHGRGKGMLHCIDASKSGDITETGRIWSYGGIERTLASPAIADGLVYIPDIAGKLHCVDARTGKPVWVHETGAEAWGSALVADGKVFFGTKQDFFVMAAGREPRELARIGLGAPIYGTPIAANGVLYVASERYLWAVRNEGPPSPPEVRAGPAAPPGGP